ncbi:hypothetical protein GWK47_054427 [Chionoecetes opilio]|uniref:Uncharacterized protein n=1 Tax=Chionoecetes opilio TaxID=41210 RepID=A0A8J4Y0A4_CHIOP|nr:hypothetical protein GWK47_054427 [Chionoecetes opilio]
MTDVTLQNLSPECRTLTELRGSHCPRLGFVTPHQPHAPPRPRAAGGFTGPVTINEYAELVNNIHVAYTTSPTPLPPTTSVPAAPPTGSGRPRCLPQPQVLLLPWSLRRGSQELSASMFLVGKRPARGSVNAHLSPASISRASTVRHSSGHVILMPNPPDPRISPPDSLHRFSRAPPPQVTPQILVSPRAPLARQSPAAPPPPSPPLPGRWTLLWVANTLS